LRTYQMNIREAALLDLRFRRGKLLEALSCPPGTETPREKFASSIFPPVRSPSPSAWGTQGHVFCFKAGGLVPYDSLVERNFYVLMEWDYTIDTFVAQPFKIPYSRPNGRIAHYTPDCFCISYSVLEAQSPRYAPTAYEIKTKKELEEDWPALKPKLRAARSFLSESGFRFRLLTEDRINPVFLENIEFLLGFRGPRFMLRTKHEGQIIKAIMEVVKDLNDGDFTPRFLLEKVSGLAAREHLIPWVWNLYADYVLQCDLLKPLTLDTVSWRVGDSGESMQNCGALCYRADWRRPENDWRR
jgi:hypothetical protein